MTVLVEAQGAQTALIAATVIGPINVTVRSGEVCLITGPARSGKSVVLGMLAGLYRLSGGLITRPPSTSKRTPHALVPQTITLVEGLTMGENILLSSRLKLSAKPAAEWTDEVTDTLKLTHLLHRTPREASYGECHRVMLARSLCTQPSVLFVDEPFAHQDPEMCESIIGLLRRFAAGPDDAACVVACRRYDAELWGKPADLIMTA
ncbi:MAG: lolD1 [Ilumatobacteraceae bacterium]|nr:lolD1 [Ilumatobacteraceae bacterium]